MSTMKYVARMERIDQLIRQEMTGKATNFAERLHISVRQLYNLIDELKDMGLPIAYCRTRQTYYYKVPCRIVFEVRIEELSIREYGNLDEGSSLNANFGIIAI